MGDFFACSVRFCHTHIFQYGRFNKAAVLKYKRYLIHQCFFRNVAYVGIAYQYAPFLRVKKPCDDICKRCLTAAGRSYQCDCLPRLYGKRYIIERVFLRDGIRRITSLVISVFLSVTAQAAFSASFGVIHLVAVTNVFQCNSIIFRNIIHAAFR